MIDVLFERANLLDVLAAQLVRAKAHVEDLPASEFMRRADAEILAAAVAEARLEHLTIDTARPLARDVEPVSVSGGQGMIVGRPITMKGWVIWAEYRWKGEGDLFWYRPSNFVLSRFQADVSPAKLRIEVQVLNGDASDEQLRRELDTRLGGIANTVQSANADVDVFNGTLEAELRPVVERRRAEVAKHRNLRDTLAIARREDAPAAIPLERKVLGTRRREAAPPAPREPEFEAVLDQADYEDIIGVIRGMLRALERTPSVASGKREDEVFLRDILLVTLNGTYKGAATGETFLRMGKTDILVRVEDRHVFVGECKWWNGPSAALEALDQLLRYVPWRDEKAALIFFIDRVNATEVLDAAEAAVRAHRAFDRRGLASDPTARRNFILKHPDDRDKEIQLAVLFAVFPPRDAE